jgi:hypothetical protein
VIQKKAFETSSMAEDIGSHKHGRREGSIVRRGWASRVTQCLHGGWKSFLTFDENQAALARAEGLTAKP